MQLSKYIKYQSESKTPFMCIDNLHIMPLVAVKNLDDQIELRCYTGHCDFKMIPGLDMHDRVLKEFPND